MVRKRRTQAEPGRECMQQQEQTSPNLERTLKESSVEAWESNLSPAS